MPAANIKGNARSVQAELTAGVRRLSEALEFNERILNTSSIGIITYKASGKCTFANKAAARIIGAKSPAKVMQLNFHRIKSWKKSGMYAAALKALKTNKEQQVDSHVISTFGKDVWLRNRFSHFMWGGRKHLLVFVADVSQERRAEEQLRIAEEKYRTIVESAADQIFMVDRRLRVTSANKKMAERIDRPQEELIGRPMAELFPDEAAGRIARNCRHVLDTGVGISSEEKMPVDGREEYVSISLNPVLDSQRRIVAVAGIVRDITRTKGTEEALKESEGHYKSLFNNSPISLFEEDFSEVKRYLDRLRGRSIFDLRKYFIRHPEEVIACAQKVRILDVNLATIRMFEGKTKQSIQGSLAKLFVYESYGAFREELVHLYRKRTPFRSEIATKTARGKVLNTIVEVSIAPDYESSWKRVLVSVTDITELKEAQEEIRKSREELENLSEATVGMELEVVELRKRLRKLENEGRPRR